MNDFAPKTDPKGTPSQPDPRKSGIQIPIGVNVGDLEKDYENVTPHGPKPREGETRRMAMTTEMFPKYGYTVGCGGCNVKLANL